MHIKLLVTFVFFFTLFGFTLVAAVAKGKQEAITVTLSQEIDSTSIQFGAIFSIVDEQLFPIEVTVEKNKLIISPMQPWETGVQIYLTTNLKSMHQHELHQAAQFEVLGR